MYPFFFKGVNKVTFTCQNSKIYYVFIIVQHVLIHKVYEWMYREQVGIILGETIRIWDILMCSVRGGSESVGAHFDDFAVLTMQCYAQQLILAMTGRRKKRSYKTSIAVCCFFWFCVLHQINTARGMKVGELHEVWKAGWQMWGGISCLEYNLRHPLQEREAIRKL